MNFANSFQCNELYQIVQFIELYQIMQLPNINK